MPSHCIVLTVYCAYVDGVARCRAQSARVFARAHALLGGVHSEERRAVVDVGIDARQIFSKFCRMQRVGIDARQIFSKFCSVWFMHPRPKRDYI